MNATTEQHVKSAAEAISLGKEFVNPSLSHFGDDLADNINWAFDNLSLAEMADYLIAIGNEIKAQEAAYQAALNQQ